MNSATSPVQGTDEAIAQAIAETVGWLERAVIGLNLCPFAKGVHVKRQVHYAVCRSDKPEELLQDLRTELKGLQAHAASARDTTLLIAPWCLPEFLDFNDFLAEVEEVLVELGLEGIFQIASFHPDFQFAGTSAGDITNYTNRAPYPTLHLLREDSIDRAVQAFPHPEEIFEENMQTLQKLGTSGWTALGLARGKIAR